MNLVFARFIETLKNQKMPTSIFYDLSTDVMLHKQFNTYYIGTIGTIGTYVVCIKWPCARNTGRSVRGKNKKS